MDEVNKVSVPLCRYEELIDIETRVNILIDKLDHEKSVYDKDIYLIFGYTKKYDALVKKEEEERERFWKERSRCQESKSATENTETEKESVAQT